MDHITNISQLKSQVKDFCEDRDWDQYHKPKDLAIGLINEASELLEHFKFKDDKEIQEMFENKTKRQEISEEIVDILYVVLRLAQIQGIDLTTELQKKMKKNEEKYPIEKAKGSNKKYNEY